MKPVILAGAEVSVVSAVQWRPEKYLDDESFEMGVRGLNPPLHRRAASVAL